MKNIFVLPTDKPSKIGYHFDIIKTGRLDYAPNFGFNEFNPKKNYQHKPQNIYITSSEEIKEGDWILFKIDDVTEIVKVTTIVNNAFDSKEGFGYGLEYCKKIILTTDQDLIKDGVQAIDEEFLEWFVKNPSCEKVEVGYGWVRLTETDNEGYWVSIPDKQFEMQQEEPKQETLEEQAKKIYPDEGYNDEIYCDIGEFSREKWIEGAKWQAERMNSEADRIMKFLDTEVELKLSDVKTIERIKWYFETYFEQFKKK